MRHLVLATVLSLSTAACLGEQPGASVSYPSQPSSYSTSTGSSISSAESVPVNVAPRPGPNELVVRPDVVEIAFVLSKAGPDPDKVLAKLEEQSKTIAQQIKTAAGQVEPRMCGVTASGASGGKFVSDSPPRYVVRVDGSFDIPLRPEQDYWARSRLMTSLAKTTRDIIAAEKADKADKVDDSPIEIGFSEPRLRVKDAEQYRDKLLARWMQRTKKLTAAAEAERSPLAIVDCTPPGDIEQRVVSMEEITLALPVTCRLGAAIDGKPRPTAQ